MSQKAQNRGKITSFFTKISRKMTLPTFFIAFLSMNFFQSLKNWIFFPKKKCERKIFSLEETFFGKYIGKTEIYWYAFLNENFWDFFLQKYTLLQKKQLIFTTFYYIFQTIPKITEFQGPRDLSRAVKFSHGDYVQNHGVRDKSRDLGTLDS